MKNKEKIKQLEERLYKLEKIIYTDQEKQYEEAISNNHIKEVADFSRFTQDISILNHPKYYKRMGYYIACNIDKTKFLLKDLTISRSGTEWETENTGFRKTELQAWTDREKYLKMQGK